MADPVPIVESFKATPWITERMRCDGVITVVDAKHCLTRLSLSMEDGVVNEAEKQIAFADKVILNKVDLVSFDDAEKVQQKIIELNQFVKIVPAVRGEVNLTELLELRAHDLSLFEGITQDVQGAEHGHGHGCSGADCEHAHGHGHGQPHRHDSRVNSIGVQLVGEMPSRGMDNLMLLFKHLSKYDQNCILFRVKGIFAFKDTDAKYAYHRVMDYQESQVIGTWDSSETKMCKLVVIGRSIDTELLNRAFESAMKGVLRVTYSTATGVRVMLMVRMCWSSHGSFVVSRL